MSQILSFLDFLSIQSIRPKDVFTVHRSIYDMDCTQARVDLKSAKLPNVGLKEEHER